MGVEALAWVAAGLFLAIAMFQVALALGAPLGHVAYGGRASGDNHRLRAGYRVASAFAAVILLAFAWVILARGGVIDTWVSQTLLAVLSWMIVAYVALNTAANLAAKNPIERYLMGGASAALVVLCSIVAAAGPS